MHILAAITFHYVEARLTFLRSCIAGLAQACDAVDVRVFTNSDDVQHRARIDACFREQRVFADGQRHVIVSETNLADAFMLAWSHKRALSEEFSTDARYTHFLYLEDDLLISRENLAYWCQYRVELKPHGLIPSFFRVERDALGIWRSTDQKKRVRLRRTPKLRLSRELWFLNLRNPYQGMYLFDRELAQEHLRQLSSGMAVRNRGIREGAAEGLIFAEVPTGFTARTVVPYEVASRCVPRYCWIHHLPNNYANDPKSRFGKLAVEAPGLIRTGLW